MTSTQATGMRSHTCGELRPEHEGTEVTLCGWVARRREHGEHLAFVDLRDRSGVVQCVVDGASELRSEYVVKVTGTVRRRPEGTVNPELPTGEIEVQDVTVEILNTAEPPPFPVDERKGAADETVRLRYRYVDLRRDRMQRNLRLRAEVNAALRRAAERQGFTEVETPLLWTPTPEGAREFVVPSRLQHGSIYVLPQSPQIAKQLLMVAGLDRYYQIARCLRDEDQRADRQLEFTQFDVEASFVTQEDVRRFVSEAVLEAAEAVTGDRPGEIPSITWTEAQERFGSDKPDLRFGMELVELTPLFDQTGFKAFQAPCVKGLRVAGASAGTTRSDLDRLTDRAKELGAKGLVWMRVTDEGLESPVAKFLDEAELSGLRTTLEAEAGDLLLLVADERPKVRAVLGQLRLDLGRPPVGEGPYRYVWVVDFPMFEVGDDGRPTPAHHPFTMPHDDDLDLLETDPLQVRAQYYDLVLNGWELGSGSIRIHRSDLQSRIFAAAGLTPEEAEDRFGFLLGAFRYGAPPHGGFAIGVDRLVAILAGEENIREVIAFPKTQSGTDPLTDAPKPVDSRILRTLGLEVARKD